MITNLNPKLRLLFPDQETASAFAEATERFRLGVSTKLVGPVVELEGADHPVMRQDIIDAAKLLGGDHIPSRRGFKQ